MWVFGDDEFDQIVEKNWFGVVELPTDTKLNVFGHFSDIDQAKTIYKKFLDPNYPEFSEQVEQIDQVLNSSTRYRFMTDLRDNPVFTCNEFKRLIFIVRDIYHNGTFHMPCSYWNGDRINSHPGNHLSFAMQLFGMPIRTLLTVPQGMKDEFTARYGAKDLIRFQTVAEMDSYFGDYLAWIQDGYMEFPAVTVKKGEWSNIDVTGFLKWPDISRTLEWAAEQWWWDWYPQMVAQPELVSGYVRLNRKFSDTNDMLSNLLGFVLNSDRSTSDENFTLLYPEDKPNTPYTDYLFMHEYQGEIRYYGNKHTQCENNLK